MFERTVVEIDRPEGWVGEDELDVLDQLELDELLGPPGSLEPQPRVHLAPDEWPWGFALPGEESAVGLDAATTEPAALSDAGLIEAIVGFERLAGWAQARQARLLAEFARRRPGDDPTMVATDKPCSIARFAPDEVGLALKLSRLTAKARLGRAVQLTEVLPETLHAWQQGELDERRVSAVCDATHYLPVEKARAVQQRVLGRAPEQTLAQLKAALKRAVLQADPDGCRERHRAARRDRRVAVGDEQEGMASLWALLSATDARSCFQWLTRLARGCGTDDPRGMDARRADLMVSLLTGTLTYATPDSEDTAGDECRAPETEPPLPVNPGKPLVQVLMPFTTLLGLDEQACELAGHGPIPAELAREIAADGTLKRLVYDPLSGALLDHGRTTYRPPAALADFVRARDVHCRGPICGRRALDSELDHIVPYPKGPTSEQNLVGGCGHDHHAKHAPGWQVRARPGRRIEWITPTGHRYYSDPHDYRPDHGPPPAPPPPSQEQMALVDPWNSQKAVPPDPLDRAPF
ncbi:HNH endonuclease [Pseudonocardia hierapolitana]|uniref:HNH endonuclease n=1 Tax=Pseudonocardia hierapolitana TaxID=1128676 RepID=A0A561SY64_9PSEU|nr:HNH endonuclease signature motif containing protein [Pseudonocardia hierapolitana]TWF79809.1 HNH endonuclease [Pseudonocardia hierapolitana]